MITQNDITPFFFIRHGPVKKKDGHLPALDAPLIDGPFDLDLLIASLPKHAAWQISPLQRAKQTAELMRNQLSPISQITEPALAEQNFGTWHDKPIAKIWEQIDKEPKHNWSFITHDTCPPYGESFVMQMERVKSWCKCQEQKKIGLAQIIFAHAGTIRAAAAHMLDLSPAYAQSIEIPHFGCLHASLMIEPKAKKNHGGAWQIHKLG